MTNGDDHSGVAAGEALARHGDADDLVEPVRDAFRRRPAGNGTGRTGVAASLAGGARPGSDWIGVDTPILHRISGLPLMPTGDDAVSAGTQDGKVLIHWLRSAVRTMDGADGYCTDGDAHGAYGGGASWFCRQEP